MDDYVEIKNIIAQWDSLRPEKIERLLIPRLQKLVSESNGRLKDFYIYPQHKVGGMEMIYENGRRRYPKREEKKFKKESHYIDIDL